VGLFFNKVFCLRLISGSFISDFNLFAMKLLVFDTETTGIPSSKAELAAQPWIIQFACIIYEYDFISKELKEVSRMDQLIKPDVEVTYETTQLTGISNQMLEGAPKFAEVVDQILEAFASADVAVAHNIEFDQKMVEIELARAGRPTKFLPEKIFDTMKQTRDLCRLPGRMGSGSYKNPRLAELHTFLFDRSFENAHNAMYDVIATGNCLGELLKRSHFVLEPKTQNSLF